MNRLASPYQKLIRYSAYLGPFVLLLVRLAWGWELAESGWGHLTHLKDTTEFFESLNIPMPHANAIISGTTELVGGTLWMLGLGTRLISIPLVFNFCVAYATASRDKLTGLFPHFFDHIDKVIDDSAFPFLVTSLLLIAFGPGLFSIDAIIKKLTFPKNGGTAAK